MFAVCRYPDEGLPGGIGVEFRVHGMTVLGKSFWRSGIGLMLVDWKPSEIFVLPRKCLWTYLPVVDSERAYSKLLCCSLRSTNKAEKWL